MGQNTGPKKIDAALLQSTAGAVDQFCKWLASYGEVSHDHQSFYASNIGRAAKALYYRQPILGTLAVAPMVASEAFLPSARTLFWNRLRFPIADAHYAMGFAFLAKQHQKDEYYQRAVHFLDVRLETRCPDFETYGWGYPFDWQTRHGVLKKDTPMITTLPYVYEAFSDVYALDQQEKWVPILRSIAEHAATCYRDLEIAPGTTSCAYTPAPDDGCQVVNASAYRAFLLTKAGIELSEQRYLDIARGNLNYVLASQNPDGSWYYSTEGERDFVDHFHTCFVLKALAKIEALTGSAECRDAIERGVQYYVRNLVDAGHLPLPFSKAPRLTVYRRELYDYAECINLAVLLAGRNQELDTVLSDVVTDLLARWRKADGSFRARELLIGWDNVPMHRWAQSQIFRSLCFLLDRNARQLESAARPVTSEPLAPRGAN
jgi:hypothetical protein